MSEDATPTEKPQRKFVVKLVQTVPEYETVTEQHEVVADNKKLALQKIQNFIDDEKEMEGVKYRLEAEEVVEEPTEDQSAASASDSDNSTDRPSDG